MSERPIVLEGNAGPVRIVRDRHGIPHIAARDALDTQLGLGYCHARDRGLQMSLVRLTGRGQLCQWLDDSDEMLQIDRFFRRLHFGRDVESQAAALSPRARAGVDAYCRGINAYFDSAGLPWELRLLGLRADGDPWTFADVYLSAKVVGYVTLAQTQADTERLIVECVQHGVDRDRLDELFPGLLGGLDEALIRKVKIQGQTVPESLRWAAALPHAAASNNWAVAGSKTASGKPILASDPHLQVNRLPAVWYEAALRWGSDDAPRYALGATMPGTPGVVIGRNADLAWGITYAYMDCIDSWVEDCRDGRYRRGDRWVPFSVRREEIGRKKRPSVVLEFFDTEHHGTLEGDPHAPGYYLSSRWSNGEETGADGIDGILGMLEARSVDEGRTLLARVRNSSWNWVLADRDGHIGYQMAGKLPLRRPGTTGLVPLPGWDPANDWSGFADDEDLPRAFDPPEGFLATANDDLNGLGRTRPINQCYGPYRAERIRAVLAGAEALTVERMTELQFDVVSTQAEQFLARLAPILADWEPSEEIRLLAEWDCQYRDDSKAAFLFEQFYRALVEEVFGSADDGGPAGTRVGDERPDGSIVSPFLDRSAFFAGFFWNFDRVLLAERSRWFGGRTRDQIYRAALSRALRARPEPYGAGRRVVFRHLLFGGKVPPAFGFDRGPIAIRGGRATVHQGQIYESRGREIAVGPSYRLVADLASDEAHTNLPGGPSDRRFSRWYANDLENWSHGRYKCLRGYGEE